MIGYKDMTFCVAACSNESCRRRLTEEVREAAHKWWGSDEAPICVSDFSGNCEQYMEIKNEN